MEHRYCDRMLAARALVIAMSTVLLVPTAVASADDDAPPPGPPPVSFTMTSGAPIRDGATYGVGTVIVAHFAAPVDEAAAARDLVVTANPPVKGGFSASSAPSSARCSRTLPVP